MIVIAAEIAVGIAVDAALIYGANKLIEKLRESAEVVAKEAEDSIEISDKPSRPGRPVHSRRGKSKRAIRVEVDEQDLTANVGFAASEMGDLMEVHEKGGQRGKRKYKARPVMGPALERSVDQLTGGFEDSL